MQLLLKSSRGSGSQFLTLLHKLHLGGCCHLKLIHISNFSKFGKLFLNFQPLMQTHICTQYENFKTAFQILESLCIEAIFSSLFQLQFETALALKLGRERAS